MLNPRRRALCIGIIIFVFWAIAFADAYWLSEAAEDHWQNIGMEWLYIAAPALQLLLSVFGIVLSIGLIVKGGLKAKTFGGISTLLLLPSFFAWLIASFILLVFGIKPFGY